MIHKCPVCGAMLRPETYSEHAKITAFSPIVYLWTCPNIGTDGHTFVEDTMSEISDYTFDRLGYKPAPISVQGLALRHDVTIDELIDHYRYNEESEYTEYVE